MSEKKIRKLTICGISAEAGLVRKVIEQGNRILARGERSAGWLRSIGVGGAAVIHLDGKSLGKGSVDLERWIGKTERDVDVLYITPVQPTQADRLAAELAANAAQVEYLPGTTDLPTIPVELEGALQTIDLFKINTDRYPVFSPALSAVVLSSGVTFDAHAFSSMLRQVYPADHTVYLLPDGFETERKWMPYEVADLATISTPLEAVLIPALAMDASLESFMQVIARLRAPDGCPWDRKQTHESLRPYLLEETYETLEVLDEGDTAGLREELGDLLLQIGLHAEIATEHGDFTISDVLQSINRILVYRHPHVFGEVSVSGEEEVLQNWEKLKEIEKTENGERQSGSLLEGISAAMPSLSHAQLIQDRAARVGFDWPDIAPVMDKVQEELQEVRDAATSGERARELGDLLFAIVNLVRWYSVDAESALRMTNTKFRKRFAYIEAEAKKAGKELPRMTLEEMDALWEAAKEFDDHP